RNDTGDALYVIADLSTMWLKAFVPEKDIPLMRLGQEVEVRVTAMPDRAYKARIAAIGASSDATTRRVMVRSELPNPDGARQAEMCRSSKIGVGDDNPAPAGPAEALIRDADGAAVWVQAEPMVFRRRMVKIGMEQDEHVQIRDGLAPGEMVVARGAV